MFSGIGGFALAARWAKIDTVGFCEIEPYPQKVLQKNFPGIPIHPDIRTLKNDGQFGTIDIISGGFPCQPFSVAGKQRGKTDDRYLWPEMFRVIKEFRPTWVIGENVTGIIRMELDDVLSNLEGEGYDCQSLIIPACAKDAPHRRDRVWIIANTRCQQSRAKKGGFSKESKYGRASGIETKKGDRPSNVCENVANSQGCLDRNVSKDIGKRRDEINPFEYASSDCRRNDRQKNWQFISDANNIDDGKSRFCTSAIPFEQTPKIQFHSNWWPESRIRRVANGVPNRVDRLKGLGNAIVPQVAYEIMKIIKQINSCNEN